MDNNNINIEEIMADIRKKIKDEDLTADMLSFEDVPYKKPVQVKAGTLEAADESLRYLNTRYYIQPYKQLQGNPVKVFIKKVLRKMIKFYIEPVVFEQNDFNANTVLTTMSFGDAIGNDAIALKGAISDMGFQTDIYAENIDKRLPNGTAQKIEKLRRVNRDDIILYHKSTGTDLTFKIGDYDCRRVMIYHNITPPEFFRPYSPTAAALTEYGYEGVEYLRDKVEYVMADSAYNKSELVKMGYKCPIDVRPILIRFKDYEQTPDENIMRIFGDGRQNLIFVGRIAPNKKQENVIRAFFCYKKLVPDARLILVGSYLGMENYYERLVRYASALGLGNDVIFTGHIKFSEILAYYRTASAFVCMSEHEGFCVPLAEAMFFRVPIIAYDTSAISDTLGGSGVLLDSNDPVFAAQVIHRVMTDEKLRSAVIEGQTKRLAAFSYENIRDIFEKQLRNFIGKDR